MPLRSAAEPRNGTALVQERLRRIGQRKNPLSEKGVDLTSQPVQPPHAIFDLRADEIAAGKGLASAHATGFHYRIGPAGSPVAAAEVHADETGAAQLVVNVNYGLFVEAAARAVDLVASLPEAKSGSYEVRLLRFSAIGLMAVWLKSDAGGADVLYPISPAPPALQAGKAYTAEELIAAIMPMARQRAESRGQLVP